jgi:hypothetical protein
MMQPHAYHTFRQFVCCHLSRGQMHDAQSSDKYSSRTSSVAANYHRLLSSPNHASSAGANQANHAEQTHNNNTNNNKRHHHRRGDARHKKTVHSSMAIALSLHPHPMQHTTHPTRAATLQHPQQLTTASAAAVVSDLGSEFNNNDKDDIYNHNERLLHHDVSSYDGDADTTHRRSRDTDRRSSKELDSVIDESDYEHSTTIVSTDTHDTHTNNSVTIDSSHNEDDDNYNSESEEDEDEERQTIHTVASHSSHFYMSTEEYFDEDEIYDLID